MERGILRDGEGLLTKVSFEGGASWQLSGFAGKYWNEGRHPCREIRKLDKFS
jgi:hypothetical protein